MGEPRSDDLAGHRYCAFYCEENVWHLCADDRVPPGPRAAVVISNAARQVAVAHQRIAIVPGFPIVWDYHVVMAARSDGQWRIWDLDCALGLDLPLSRWLHDSFGGGFGFGDEYAPKFRVVAGPQYRATLSSDRSHMRDAEGNYQSPPPPWPAPGEGPSNLMRFVAFDDAFVGEVVDATGLSDALTRCVTPA